MTKPIEQTSPYDLGQFDRLMFDDELSGIDRMGRSARRVAVNERGYPKPRRVGLRSAWLYSEVMAWVRAQPPANERPRAPHKALGEGIKKMRAKHGQRVAEAGTGEAA
jgi:predicted DNA-binding transcriptional regulator AlpA